MNDLEKCQKQLNDVVAYNYELEMQIQLSNEKIKYQRIHDLQTDILNQTALQEVLIKGSNRVYILLNIDNFSSVNSAYGYEVGNDALHEVIRFLNIIKPSEYELYRFCADKFVLLSEVEHENIEISESVESLLSFFNSSNIIVDNDISIHITFTVGISTAKGISAITEAEVALKEVRTKRSNSYYIYDDRLNNLVLQQESVYWINKIRDSIIDEDIIVHYQPILNNQTNEIEKYECLSRIQDEERLVSPYSFMEAAIATNVLYLMTQNVIREACRTFSECDYEFSINITKDDLNRDYLEDYLVKYSSRYNISPSRIVLEILEDISSLNEIHILGQLASLRESGFKIAIDDFGAEHSNFSRLLEFQPDYLKIDGAFIKNIATDRNSRIITESILYICKQSGIKVIAEYIHNREVLDIVQEIGVEYSQGFYIGAPTDEPLYQRCSL